MNPDTILRRAFGVSVFYNLGGAFLFAWPSSPIGQMLGLPQSVPLLYCGATAFFIGLFAGAYAWLATSTDIDRPLVVVAMLGKASFFVLMLGLWLLSEVSGRMVLVASGDMVFAGIFAWWLQKTRG